MSPDEPFQPIPFNGSDRGSAAAGPAGAVGRRLPATRHRDTLVNRVERRLEEGADRAWARFTHRPYVGALLAGGAGLTAAMLFGAAELALAAGVGYAAYKALKRRVPPSHSIKEALRLEEQLAK